MGDSADPVEIGEVVEGRYKILQLVGRGGMGSVFLAEHWLIKRRVAIKFLHRELITDADMIRRFMNEALAAGTLGHPNIVEATDMGFTKSDIPYIVFEYVDGTSLTEEVGRVGALPVRRALRIAAQIASALEAAHSAGIVHRDLKSENVFVTDKDDMLDHVKVLDFGISRFLAASDRTALGDMTMGTPEFMAPEQITSPESVDKRADIYALGVVLHEMLAGSVPFPFVGTRGDLDATHALLHRILGEIPPSIDRADAPPGLAEMITDKLLAKDPADRYASMRDVRGALDAFASVTSRTKTITIPPRVEPASDEFVVAGLSDSSASRNALGVDDLAREVKQLGKRWTIVAGELRLELFNLSMARLAEVVSHTAAIADETDQHPKITIDFPRLSLVIRPEATQFSAVDLVFAARIEQWLLAHGW
ncbi:MAG: serine/threonine protein kinase [Myxococcales bacterium]|nr:serine/threonine protein kinase [Myxococcales bacterium]